MGDNILDKLFEDLSKQDKHGPPIHDKLVSIVNKLHVEPKEETQINDLLKEWLKPSNCELNVPRINPEVWKVMQNHQHTQDVKLQKVKEHDSNSSLSACRRQHSKQQKGPAQRSLWQQSVNDFRINYSAFGNPS